MQRYLASAFGYKYVSSPFQSATVDEFSDDVDLTESFPTFYRYDENEVASGWIDYTSTSGLLVPMYGYAANFGSSSSPKTIDMSGVVNNNTITCPSLYNHDQLYTQGFNLTGNPYPSPVDWDISSGWTRSNIDDAIYYFNAGDTDRYTGSYSSYVNGVSSDSVASGIIPSMQGFFVHVTDGSFPVSGTLQVNNSARSDAVAPVFQRPRSMPLLRLCAGFMGKEGAADAIVFYFDDNAGGHFNKTLDALKLMNTDTGTPNLYAISPDSMRLSIRALPYSNDSIRVFPIGLKTESNGDISFTARDIEQIPDNNYIYLHDNETGIYHDLRQNPEYGMHLQAGKYENRFSIVFSLKAMASYSGSNEVFDVYVSGNGIIINTNIPTDEKSRVIISSALGVQLSSEPFTGNGTYGINTGMSSGMYIVSLLAEKQFRSKKIMIAN
jgi:hypothetical protein